MNADQADPTGSNDSASASVTPQAADLTLTKTVDDTTPNVGDTVKFTVTLTDDGPDAATNVAVTDRAWFIVTTQDPVPEQASDQPEKTEPGSGVARSVTFVP